MGREPLGYTMLSISAIWAVWAVARLWSTISDRASTGSRRAVIRRYLGTIIGFGLIAYAAFRLVTNTGDATTYTATGALLLLITATMASWQLLTKVAEDKYRAGKDS
jgi:hypothetical protein